MTLLRRRMLEDLHIRNYAPGTCEQYICHVARFARHFGRSPERLGLEEIRAYQVHLLEECGLSISTLKIAVSALRFLYTITLRRNWDLRYIPYPRSERKLQVVLSRGEVARLLNATRGLRELALLMTAYSTGVRVSELLNLQISDVDGERRVIHIRQGKGRKDRYVPLFPRLHETLRSYYREFRPGPWLFPGASPDRPLGIHALNGLCRRARERAGIEKRVTSHVLRRSFGTHLHEGGVDLRIIQVLLGHASIRTVQVYTLISSKAIGAERTGLDLLHALDIDLDGATC